MEFNSTSNGLLAHDYTDPTNGIAGGYRGGNSSIIRAMVAFSAIAWYNSVELIFLILIRFKKWKGLYFWSLMVTSLAIILYQVGAYGKMTHLLPDHPLVMELLTNIPWLFMVTGESLVLYSRLHLLSQNRILLRCVLYGILLNSVLCYVPTTVLDINANIIHTDDRIYVRGYGIEERIQMTMFTVQEIAISTIYLIEAYKFMKTTYMGDKRSRNIMYELAAINIFIIAIDVALLVVAQLEYFAVEVTLKGLVYSIKLKLELGVLSRLVHIVCRNSSGLQQSTFENDLANLDNNEKAFGGLDFCTSPLNSETSKDSHLDSKLTPSPSPEKPRPQERKPRSSVPWLMSSTRAKRVESESPLRPPAIFRPSQHKIQRGNSYRSAEFLTSAAVTESANDDTLRQFQQEIEAELGGVKSRRGTATMHRSLPSRDSTQSVSTAPPLPQVSIRSARDDVEKQMYANNVAKSPRTIDFKTDEEDEGEEEGWAKGLGVLGSGGSAMQARPEISRESSLGDLYPGRLTGENG